MDVLRAFLGRHRRVAALVLTFALCMKALLPAGYMVGQHATVLTVEICADATGGTVTKQIAVPRQAKPGDGGSGQAKPADACPYSGFAMPSLAAADPALLALALAFILALGFAPTNPAPLRRFLHVRPPLRGPPALV